MTTYISGCLGKACSGEPTETDGFDEKAHIWAFVQYSVVVLTRQTRQCVDFLLESQSTHRVVGNQMAVILCLVSEYNESTRYVPAHPAPAFDSTCFAYLSNP